MGQSPAPSFACPHCGKMYRWKSQAAGRKVRCGCEQLFVVPEDPQAKAQAIGAPPTGEPSPTYELDDESARPTPSEPQPSKPPAQPGWAGKSRAGKCPSCNRPLKPDAVICLNCGFHLLEGKKMQTAVLPAAEEDEPVADEALTRGTSGGLGSTVMGSTIAGDISARRQRDEQMAAEAARTHRFNDLHLPLILIAAAIPLNAIVDVGVPMLIDAPGWGLTRGLEYLLRAGLRLVIQFPTIVLGIFAVAKLFGSSYGGLGTALLKLLSVTVVTGLAYDLTALAILFLTGGSSVFGAEQMMALLIAASVFWGLCIKLFEMDPPEIMAMLAILIIGPFALGIFIIAPIIAILFG